MTKVVNYYFDSKLQKHPQKSMYNFVKDSLKTGGYVKTSPSILPKVLPIAINEHENGCTSISYKPSLTQFMFSALIESIATNHLDKKGFIGWLSTGAGKTIVAASVIDKFWNTNKTIYYISRHDSLKPHEDFLKLLKLVWKRNDISLNKLYQKFKILSIASFSNRIKAGEINPNETVVIIDEAQYLFASRAIPALKSKHEYLIDYLLKRKTNELKVFILTATPGDNLNELATLLNIVKSHKEKYITKYNYKKHVSDKVLYLNMNKDFSVLPNIIGMFENIIDNNLNEEQTMKYIEKVHELRNELEDDNKKYKAYQILQKWSNSLYIVTEDEVSNKIKSILKTIKKYPNDKHFIYSQYYKQGVQDLISTLNSNGYMIATKENMNTKSKKFLLAKASDNFIASDDKNPIFKKYNAVDNKHGKFIQLFIATDSYNTGIDLKATKHIHFMEPTLEFLDTVQGVGRGARFCSHKDLDKKDWTVKVHTYISQINADIPSLLKKYHSSKYKNPDKHIDKINNKINGDLKHLDIIKSVDRIIFEKGRNDYVEYFRLLNPLRENAIDCRVMSNFHNNLVNKNSPFYLSCSEGNVKKNVHEGKPNPLIFTNDNKKFLEERLKREKEIRDKIIKNARTRLDDSTKKLQNAAQFAQELKTLKLKLNQNKAISKIQKARQLHARRHASIVKFAASLRDKKMEMNFKMSRIKQIFDNKQKRYKDAVELARKMKDKKQSNDLLKGIEIVKRQLYLQTMRHKKAIRRSKKAILLAKELQLRQKKLQAQKEFLEKQKRLNNRKQQLENQHKQKMEKEKQKQYNRQTQLKMLQEGKLSQLHFDTEKTPCEKLVYRHKGWKSKEESFTRDLCKKRNDCQIITKHPFCKTKKFKIPILPFK